MMNKAHQLVSKLMPPTRIMSSRHDTDEERSPSPHEQHPVSCWTIEDFHFGPPIGKGRFQNVYAAQHKATSKVRGASKPFGGWGRAASFASRISLLRLSDKVLAIKVVPKDQPGRHHNESAISQLQHEVHVHCTLDHPRVVRCYGYFQDENQGMDHAMQIPLLLQPLDL